MSVNELFLTTLTGLQIGSIYMLIALGLTLIFGTLGVVNFAHGALYAVAAYLAVNIAGTWGFVPALIIVPIVLFVLGIAMERGLIQYFYNRPHTDQILVTFGLAIVVQEALKWYFGANNIPFNLPEWGAGQALFVTDPNAVPKSDFFQSMLQIPAPFLESNAFFPKWRLILLAVSMTTVFGVFALLQFTRFGLIVRAGMRDAEMLRFLGINITRHFMLVFGLGALIAGIAGLFGGPVTQVSPDIGMAVLVPSFLVVVIGGMGSLPGAVLAGFMLGLASAFTADIAALQQVIIYLVAVVVLLVRPRGLFGQKGLME